MKNKKLGLLIFTIVYVCCMCLIGCSKEDGANSSTDGSSNIVLTVDDVSITLAEARYYAYNKQASYEVYYFASGSDINWNESYYNDSDITLEMLVKAEVLEQMKEAIIVSEYAKDEGVKLDDEDVAEIEAMADKFLTDSKKELLDKADISKDDLISIYTRQMYCRKIYEKLQIADDMDAQNALYEELSSDEDVSLNSDLWETIAFESAIYTVDDVEVMEE